MGESEPEARERRTLWVCDGCMRTVTRGEIADMVDGEHVLCTRCLLPCGKQQEAPTQR